MNPIRHCEESRQKGGTTKQSQNRDCFAPLRGARNDEIASQVLLYFVRYPEPGKVKTRLAEVIGREEAARVYKELAETIFRVILPFQKDPLSIVVAFDPPEAEKQIRTWLPGACGYLPQKGEALGARLEAAFRTMFEHGARKVVALGSDTLELRAAVIQEALDALNHFDLALGPARDGGYYLMGLNAAHPALFQGIPWSTSEVLGATIRRARELQLSYYLLDELSDLDKLEQVSVIARRPKADEAIS